MDEHPVQEQWKRIVGYTLLSLAVLITGIIGWLFLRRPAQRPAPNVHLPMTAERIARGREVWMLAECDDCHSAHDSKNFAVLDEGRGAGNVRFARDFGEIDNPNITPDPETGIGTWTDGEKIRAIREGIGKDGRALFPAMPYWAYRSMSDEDAYALVVWMNTLPPIHHVIPKMKVKFPGNLLIKGIPQPLNGPVPQPDMSKQRTRGTYLVTIGICDLCHTPFTWSGADAARRFAGGTRFEESGKVVYSANISPDQDTGIGSWTLPFFRLRFRAYRNSWPSRFTTMPWHTLAQLSDEDLESIYYVLKAQKAVSNRVNPFCDQPAAVQR